jgi:conjugative relaxase-like TrwC/TraI family protein
VALGREDYYAGEGERPGRWIGGGAEQLGLSGEVTEGQTGHLLSGEHPATGEALGRSIEEGSVAGFDLTFNAPKSVGLAFVLGDPWTARVLRECHEQAVNDALSYLERQACVGPAVARVGTWSSRGRGLRPRRLRRGRPAASR